MSNNPFGIKPIKIKPINIYGSQRSGKRTLGIRDKHILMSGLKNAVRGAIRK
jgi:hypothetical protein